MVKLTWPGGEIEQASPVTVTYTVQPDDCGTVLPFTASAVGLQKEAKVPVVKFATQTEASVPLNRERKKLGIGELVGIRLFPDVGTVTWSLFGDGEIEPLEDTHKALFTAPEEAAEQPAETVVKATLKTTADETIVAKEITCSVTFTIVEPSGASIKRWPNTDDRHKKDTCSAGFWGEVYILPEDVSFSGITVFEGSTDAILTGYWQLYAKNPLAHHNLGPDVAVIEGTNQHPNIVEFPDGIYTEATIARPEGTTWEGTFTWNIPLKFRLPDASGKQFAEAMHLLTSAADGTATQYKGTASGGYVTGLMKIDDPDSGTSTRPENPPD